MKEDRKKKIQAWSCRSKPAKVETMARNGALNKLFLCMHRLWLIISFHFKIVIILLNMSATTVLRSHFVQIKLSKTTTKIMSLMPPTIIKKTLQPPPPSSTRSSSRLPSMATLGTTDILQDCPPCPTHRLTQLPHLSTMKEPKHSVEHWYLSSVSRVQDSDKRCKL